MATCLLIRHGRTTANSSGVLAGWSAGVSLDEAGQTQAQAVGERLRDLPLAYAVTSPLTRCQETARLVLDGRDLGVDDESDLGECHYGGWTGRALKELTQDPLWRVVQDHPSAATFPPDDAYEHESLAQMQARAVAAVRRIDRQVEQEHGERAVWVAFSHGDVIKAILADALGMHLDLFQRIGVNPASVSVVHYTPRRSFVLRSNDNGGGLSDIVPPAHEANSSDAAPGGATGVADGTEESED